MKAQNVKQFLSQGRCLRKRILADEERLAEWNQRVTSISSGLKEIPVQSSSTQRAAEDAVCAIADLQACIMHEMGELARIERRISHAIVTAPLAPVDRYILELRYLNGLTWEEISVRAGYTYRRVLQRHGAALLCMAQNCEVWQ